LVDLEIGTHDSGYYDGFSRAITIPAKIIVSVIIMWTIFFPVSAMETLNVANSTIIASFSGWYVYLVATLIVVCGVLALAPQTGSLRIGAPDEKPEFSRFSWFSMLFGAGIGIGMLTYSTGEPLAHFANNPDIIRGTVAASSPEAVRSAFMWTFLHWGFGAWCTYALVGLAIGYMAHRRGLPLTIRSSLAPLFGKSMSGTAGHIVDIVAVVATILGVAVTMGLGVEQFVAGLHRIGIGDWLMREAPSGSGLTASPAAITVSLLVLVGASTLSALSGVGRGIKWLSNLNMGLSFALLALFAIAGSGFYALKLLGTAIWDYVVTLPANSLTLFQSDGIWMALAGGTAIELELSGAAQGSILETGLSDQLYATLAVLLSPEAAFIVSGLVVVLLMTYLITSVDSAILIVNTINGAGENEGKRRYHILFWGAALAFMVGSMLIIGDGIEAIRITMIIGALPFSLVVVAMGVSIVKAVIFDLIRKHHGVPTTAEACSEWDGQVSSSQ
jgi:choline-glycine betaine transporter